MKRCVGSSEYLKLTDVELEAELAGEIVLHPQIHKNITIPCIRQHTSLAYVSIRQFVLDEQIHKNITVPGICF